MEEGIDFIFACDVHIPSLPLLVVVGFVIVVVVFVIIVVVSIGINMQR